MFYALWNIYDKVKRTSQVNSHWYFLFHSSQTDIGIGQKNQKITKIICYWND